MGIYKYQPRDACRMAVGDHISPKGLTVNSPDALDWAIDCQLLRLDLCTYKYSVLVRFSMSL
jgi:hypothetical protein